MKNAKLTVMMIGFFLGCIVTYLVVPRFIQARIDFYQAMLDMPLATEEEIEAALTFDALQRADKRLQNDDAQGAIDILRPVVETWSSPVDQASAYQLLAVAEMNLSNYESAIIYAEKMAQLSPGSFCYQLLGTAYESNGQFEEAMEAYQTMLTYDDGDARTDIEYVNERTAVLSEELGITSP